jgi:4'-phosphopantetheinyl transferase
MAQLLDTDPRVPAGDGRVPGTGECHLWSAPIRSPHEWAGALSPEEGARAGRLPAGVARDTFVTSRGLQRLIGSHYLGTAPEHVRIVRTCAHCGADHGRPRFAGAGIDYSVSHTRSWVLIGVVSEGLVGIDLDTAPSGRTVDKLIPKTLTPREQNVLARTPEDERPAAFVRLWTRKEAAVKLAGRGLAAGLNHMDAGGPTLLEAGDLPDGWPTDVIHLLDLPVGDGHVAAVAGTRRIHRVVPCRAVRPSAG